MIEQPMMVKICDIIEESSTVKTFFLSLTCNLSLGNLLWCGYRFSMKNLYYIYIQKNIFGISVLKEVYLQMLHVKKIGGTIGIRSLTVGVSVYKQIQLMCYRWWDWNGFSVSCRR